MAKPLDQSTARDSAELILIGGASEVILQLFQFMTDLPGTVVEFSHVAAWPNLIEGPLVIA